MEVEVVGRSKKQIGPDTEVEAKQKEGMEKKEPLKYKPFSAFSDAPPSAYGLTPSSEDAQTAQEKNSIFNFKSNSVKTQMKSYDPFFPSSKKEKWITMESPHLPDLNDTLAIRYDGDPTIPPLVKQLAASPAPSLPPFHTYSSPQSAARSQRRSDDWELPRMQNGHASFFSFAAPSTGNLEVLVEKSGAMSRGRKMIKFGEGGVASGKKQPSKKIVTDQKAHRNESERMIAEALEKLHQRRKKSESRYYEKDPNSKDSDYDAEKLIEEANITEFLKL